VRQISRQKPGKAFVVRQPKKVYCEMIEMGVKSITIVRALTGFFKVTSVFEARLLYFEP
jgi:hypothetical protein